MDIETLAVRYLVSKGFDAYYEAPAKRPKELVTLQRIGGGKANIATSSPLIAIQCWGKSRKEACDLCQRVKAVIPGMATITNVNRATLNSEAPFPGENGEPRYQLLIELNINE